MKMVKQFSLGMLLVSGACGVAQAAVDPATVTTATADVTFTSPVTATITLTPVTGLVAGNIPGNTVVANGHVESSDKISDVAWRWTPGSGTIHDVSGNPQNGNIVTSVKGNSLDVKFLGSVGNASFDAVGGYWHGNAGASGPAGVNLTISTINTQTVVADTYPLSMDAAVWLP